MKLPAKKILPLLILSLMLFSVSCMENEGVILDALFEESSNSGNSELGFDIYITYDTNGNRAAEMGELIGFDMYFNNNSEHTISSINVQITDFYNWGIIDGYSTDSRSIDLISSGDSRKPEGYWCFDCGTVDELYVGNFYFRTTEGNASQNLEITFSISYTYNYIESKNFEGTYNFQIN